MSIKTSRILIQTNHIVMVDKKYHMYYGCFVNMFFSQGKKKTMYLKFIESALSPFKNLHPLPSNKIQSILHSHAFSPCKNIMKTIHYI
jgi:hypothetical protein